MRLSSASTGCRRARAVGCSSKKNRQHPRPSKNSLRSLRSLTQSTSGVGPSFWGTGDGTAYGPTLSLRSLSCSAGVAESSDDVPVSAHTSRSREVPVPLASSAALLERKNSVPPAALLAEPGGEIAGQIVKPGLPSSAPTVSNWTSLSVGEPSASARLDIA